VPPSPIHSEELERLRASALGVSHRLPQNREVGVPHRLPQNREVGVPHRLPQNRDSLAR
jgi:hypothetical protein